MSAEVVPIKQPMIQPPVNFEAEMALLAAILQENRAYERVAEIIRADQFADPRHGKIFETCGTLIERGGAATPITLKSYFERDESLADMGGLAYIAKLAAASVTTFNVKAYAEAIEDAWLRRSIMAECQTAVDMASNGENGARALIEQLETALYSLAETPERGELATIGTAAQEMMDLAKAAEQRGGSMIGITTGFIDLDRMTGGLERGNLYVVGARPSMGKTAFALWMAWNTARAGNRVLFFSLEMARAQLARRIASGLCGIGIHDIKTGRLADNDWRRLFEAQNDLNRALIAIDDRPGLGLSAIRNRARRMKRRGGLALIIIDHLQLMRLGGKIENRRLEIGAITGGLKSLAKELDLPIVLLSQLSRAVEARDDKRPVLSDLRESGDIEQDADVVTFIYRDHYYAERERPQRRPGEGEEKFSTRLVDWQARLDEAHGTAELIVAKQRDGAVGTIKLMFDERVAKFANLHRGKP